MKVTKKMVKYWYGDDVKLDEIFADIVEIANGDYDVKMLRDDIIKTNS
tara:strand:+ start:29372 stop:29515 length:144 start_codon:yes stop_codon:yes gene_type:complete